MVSDWGTARVLVVPVLVRVLVLELVVGWVGWLDSPRCRCSSCLDPCCIYRRSRRLGTSRRCFCRPILTSNICTEYANVHVFMAMCMMRV